MRRFIACLLTVLLSISIGLTTYAELLTPRNAVVSTEKGSLNMRKKPDDTAEILVKIPNGESVELIEHGEKWCKITFFRKTGYAKTEFLKTDNTQGSSQTSANIEEEMLGIFSEVFKSDYMIMDAGTMQLANSGYTAIATTNTGMAIFLYKDTMYCWITNNDAECHDFITRAVAFFDHITANLEGGKYLVMPDKTVTGKDGVMIDTSEKAKEVFDTLKASFEAKGIEISLENGFSYITK